jgi:polyhydroxybutyrate depolymerase
MKRSSCAVLAASLFLFLPACGSSDEKKTAEEPAPFEPPTPDACLTDVTPGEQALHCEDLDFVLTVPETCTTSACGFIVDVHGFAMDANLQDTHTRFRTIATDAGYIVLQPSAPGAFPASWSVSNDAQVFALMNHVIDVWHPDAKRIHFGGYSQGGFMTWRFACNHADLIASVAPIAAGSAGVAPSCAFSETERPSRELPVFYTHGTTDGLVNYATAITQRDAVIAAWSLEERAVLGKADDYEWDRYESPSGNVFEFAHHDWQTAFVIGPLVLKGHCFPGSGELLGCGADTAFVWGEEVLKFYRAHPMP